ncbi:MAG TPA: acyltransferase [Labilithrix sp.]|jgi:peptidoglycan/LPS O-acetylase OafA/YrhL
MRFSSLDGLRCLAIVPVVWHHATPSPPDGALGRGPLGVDLFFAISGFLITTLLLRERERLGRIALGRFYARRSLRIFPMYYLVLGAFVLHAWLVREPGAVRDHFLKSLPFHATYTTNWLVDFDVPHAVVFTFAWSLATEEQFYLVWPWILRARGLVVPAAFMLALLVVDQATERGLVGVESALVLRILRSIATPICLGSLLAIGLASRFAAALRAVLGRQASAPIALALLAASVVVPWSLFGAHALMVALVGACVVREDHGLRFVTDARVVQHVGVVSYGVYLLNVPIVVATRRALGPLAEHTVLVFVVALAATVLAATLAHRLVDRPLLAFRERLRA